MSDSQNQDQDVPAEDPGFSENEFEAKLREIGRLREPKGNVPEPKGEFTPVEVKGKPISESVVEERR